MESNEPGRGFVFELRHGESISLQNGKIDVIQLLKPVEDTEFGYSQGHYFAILASHKQARAAVQPSVEELNRLGIKVRDFAYEQTLPPVLPYRRVPIQSQPDPYENSKRARQDESIFFSQGSSQRGGLWDPYDQSKVKRQKTEPALPEEQEPPDIQRTRQLLSQLSSHIPDSQLTNPGISQDTTGWVDTPLVTPNGSLQLQEDVAVVSPDDADEMPLPESPRTPTPPKEATSRYNFRQRVPPTKAPTPILSPPPRRRKRRK